MNTTRHVISVEPSWRHQSLLLIGHLLVAALAWYWLPDAPGSVCVMALSTSLGYSLYQASHRRFTVEWTGNALYWQQRRYELGTRSRVGPGFLWLDLQGLDSCRLWIFSDSLPSLEYRRLARLIALSCES